MRWLTLFLLLNANACCLADRAREREERQRQLEEHIKKKTAEAEAKRAEENARKAEEQAEQNKEIERARVEDAVAAKAARKPFANKVKREARCASVEIEGRDQDTLHAEGCEAFEPPLTSPALFQEAQGLGFWRIHNHSIGKAWCSYYLANFPKQKTWKCNNSGGSWPGM